MAVDIFEPRIMTQMIEAGQNTKHTWLRDRYFEHRVGRSWSGRTQNCTVRIAPQWR